MNISVTNYEDQIKYLNLNAASLAHDMPEGYVEEMYLSANLAELLSMMIDCGQNEGVENSTQVTLVDRVVRINKFIPKLVLHLSGVHYVLCSGLYITVPMYLLPHDKVEESMNNRYNSVLNPEDYGLPSHDLADYSTIKSYDGDLYSVIPKLKNSYLKEFITSAKNYTHVFMPRLSNALSIDNSVKEDS